MKSDSQAEYKKYTRQAKTSIRGESFFELLVSSHAVPHHITGPKDLGIDYLCEWTFGDKPSGILFAAQVKTFAQGQAKFVPREKRPQFNNLESCDIRNPNLRIDGPTLSYWHGLGIPAYLFAIEVSQNLAEMRCFYKRYTQHITTKPEEDSDFYCKEFYEVSTGTAFLAFADGGRQRCGFARDLFVDHVRCAYAKGTIAFPDPRAMGLEQFSKDAFFGRDLYHEYKVPLHATFERFKRCMASVLVQDDDAVPWS